MAQSLSKVYLHITFSTKNRVPIIEEKVRLNLQAYMVGVLSKQGSYTEEIYANPDHIHILCSLPRVIPISKLVQELKSSSSRWIKTQGVSNFKWQDGYGVFSVSYYDLEKIINYIKNQKQHHRKKDFKKEYLSFLKEYDIDFNPDYLWD